MEQPGRDELIAWSESRPVSFFDGVPDLTELLGIRMRHPPGQPMLDELRSFGRTVSDVIEPAVVLLERNREFPKLRSFDELGRHIEAIEFHPAQADAAAAAWGSKMLSGPLGFEADFDLAAKFLLLSHVGEGGQACPIVCSIGLRRALEHRGSPEIADRYLPGLMSADASRALRGSQFLTEVQGGSDVGANVTLAIEHPTIPGAYAISGEKWFCSVADADLFAITARPASAGPGTRGLACFLVPRTLDGITPNGFRIRRLKDKLGTRALASGEIDFTEAAAWPIGELDEGFKIAVTELLNTSRWLNALGSTGIMSRAWIEASSFADHRRAFGVPIRSFPLVREQLAMIRTETAAALSSSFALTELVGRIDAGEATDEQVAVHRLLVNANKFATSISASEVVHQAIELLGGNGTIEDFSPLPRLYRDALVFESWEGTHNVLCAQVQRDCVRLDLLSPVASWIRSELSLAPGVSTGEVERVEDALTATLTRLDRSRSDDAYAAIHFRRHLARLMHVIQAACLLREAAHAGARPAKSAEAALFIRRHLATDVEPGDDPSWSELVDAVTEPGA
jgi:alkylation response protein AidB-like acyl-CoA dehydrogenase